MLVCPACGSADEFIVHARQDILLDSNEDHIVETFEPAVYWDDGCGIQCDKCGYEGPMSLFRFSKFI